ncbi:MAG: hypothetical protein R3C02_13610 [Planctomycetaceae bacterium]
MSAAEVHPMNVTRFTGFEPLKANYLYCPNQFLDVCLPHVSRSVLRLVAYILDQTLGWLDTDGNPRSQNISVSYQQLVDRAGLGRGGIRPAIDEAIERKFIRRVREGRAAAAGANGEQGAFALCWDETETYQDTPETFQGFYTGEGHRTPIPNAYFRQIIPRETLTVTKVVGMVLRHTVGYQNQFGGRRSQAPLSYRFIQELANIPDPKTVREALSSAVASRYIVCVEEGIFHPDPNSRRPATYAVNWLRAAEKSESGSKNPAGKEQFKKTSSSGSENPAVKQFRKPSNEKTETKDSLKQQVAVAASLKSLRETGFDEPTAQRLSAIATTDQIQQQIDWLPRRTVSQNRLGMLRKAIEENWSEPDRPPDIRAVLESRREREDQQSQKQAVQDAKTTQQKQRRIDRWKHLEQVWHELSASKQKRIEAVAYARQHSDTLRRLFQTSEKQRLRECLRQLDSNQSG